MSTSNIKFNIEPNSQITSHEELIARVSRVEDLLTANQDNLQLLEKHLAFLSEFALTKQLNWTAYFLEKAAESIIHVDLKQYGKEK